ncbi:hypothetical protein FMN50_10120 [Rhodobacterales bacterium]|nr:hypothetical protein FMN50_10120 [Rhodobacterales bacterium]
MKRPKVVFGRRRPIGHGSPEGVSREEMARDKILSLAADLTSYESEDCRLDVVTSELESFLFIMLPKGRTMRISFMAESGYYVLSETEYQSTNFLMTTDRARTMEHIIALIFKSEREASIRTTHTVVEQLVGTTLEETERQLVIRTLSYFSGNRSLAAHTLGLSEKELSSKLTSYLRLVETGPD